MSAGQNIRLLVSSMLKEEYRLHTSYSGRRAFLTFPVVIFIFSFFASLGSNNILANMGPYQVSLRNLLAMLHISIFLYGLSVGAFGFLGRQYIERRYSGTKFIISLPGSVPVTFKQTFLALYLRDAIFYTLLILIPVAVGLIASIPITHFNLTSVLLLFLATYLSFMLGMAFSFFITATYTKSKLMFIVSVSIVIAVLGLAALFVSPTKLLPSLMFQEQLPPFPVSVSGALGYLSLSTGLIVLFTAGAVFFVQEYAEEQESRSVSMLRIAERRFGFAGQYRTLLAKEFIDIIRSGTATKLVFSYLAPLFFLTLAIWFMRFSTNLPLQFNTIFYAAMLGFFGVIIYSWQTNMDVHDYYSPLPVTVPQIIRVKLIAYFILALPITAAFVIGISILSHELAFLPMALPTSFAVSAYMVCVTAYLTGLRTNTFLFDFGVVLKFALLALLPDTCLTILSFSISIGFLWALSGIFVVLGFLFIATMLFYRGLEKKWTETEFPG